MAYRTLILWFLRLGPMALGVISALIFVGAYFLQVESNTRQAADRRAIEAGPPAAVEVQAFDRALDVSPVREAMIEAQLLWDYSYNLSYEKDWTTDYVVMFPIVAPTESDPNAVRGFAMLTAKDSRFSTFTPAQVKEMVLDDGKLGPVMSLNGEIRGLGQWRGLVEESMVDMGLAMPEDAVVIWPYMDGRAAALGAPADGTFTIFGILSKVAGVIGLLALAKLAFHRTEDGHVLAHGTEDHEDADQSAAAAPMGYGLVQTAPFEASHAEPVVYDSDPIIASPRRFSLRKALIGIVGGAFVLLAGSVIYGMAVTGTPTVAQAPVQAVTPDVVNQAALPPQAQIVDGTPEDIVSKGLAFADAASEWFAGLIDAAATGDMTAAATLLAVVLAAFFGIIGIKKLFGLTGRMRLGDGDFLEDLGLG
ncbi:hypothetical protein [Pseudooctadecabacter sp.]|uniref:hypothetical protein n=1 Tax=Pseudooctadecabacter sp. TaxID=1966338 RepID=UPI0025E38417|nr:hypothetical protein [Pseudooctadecabacter sp.]